MKAVDKNSDGLIDYDEFEESMQQMVRDQALKTAASKN